jgi:hypothetical protein
MDADLVPPDQPPPGALPQKVPGLSRLRLAVVRMLSSGVFGMFITLVILVNTAVMALDHYPSSE